MKKKCLLLTAVATLGLSAATMAQNVPNYLPTNGLVGWWPFNGNANDESVSGNNGVVYGASMTSDRFGNLSSAYSFDGVDDYIDLGINTAINSLDQNYTISFFIFKNDLNSSMILGNIDPSIVGNGWRILLRTTTIFESSFRNSANWFSGFSNPNSITQNNWIHLVSVRNNSSMKIYVNGVLESNTDIGLLSPNIMPNAQTKIGKHWVNISNNYEYINGKLDDLGIWNRALSDCEIKDLFSAQLNSVSGSISVNPPFANTNSSVVLSTTSQSQYIQWQNNPIQNGWQNIPSNDYYFGETTNSLTISNVQINNNNQPFRVISTSGECTDTSEVVTISVLDTCITLINDTTYIMVTDTLLINTLITSINPPNNSNTIKVYPNPANSHITIDYGDFAIMTGYQVRIENSIGQEVFQTSIMQQSDYLNLDSWGGNGLYFVYIVDPQGNTIDIRKIVLQ
jgi:hypothetical protein